MSVKWHTGLHRSGHIKETIFIDGSIAVQLRQHAL